MSCLIIDGSTGFKARAGVKAFVPSDEFCCGKGFVLPIVPYVCSKLRGKHRGRKMYGLNGALIFTPLLIKLLFIVHLKQH